MFGGCLRNVSPSDRLFVIIHKWHDHSVGGSRHPQLARVPDPLNLGQYKWEHQSDDVKEYTPVTLARAIQREGLHAGFTDLYACICDRRERCSAFRSGPTRCSDGQLPRYQRNGFPRQFPSD